MPERRPAIGGIARLLSAAALAIACAAPAGAVVYKYVDANGITHYTDRKPASGINYKVIVLDPYRAAQLDWTNVPLNLTDFTHEIGLAASAYNVDPALVRAVIHAESWFNTEAVSRVGAQGLMQLMPATQRRFGVYNAFDSRQNIDAGVRYLKLLLNQFRGDVKLAAAAYNAGESAVERFGGIPPYPETRQYVERVVTLHGRYRRAL